MSEYYSEKLTDVIDKFYLVLAVVAACFIEYLMIIEHSYADFPSPIISIQLYLVIMILSLVIYRLAWDIPWGRLLNIFFRTFGFILPIGLALAYYEGYTNETLINLEWLFTHDMIYVILVSQIIVILILLAGLKDYVVVSKNNRVSDRERFEEVMESEFDW